MLRQDLSARSLELRAERTPFVHTRVVLAEAPTSAKPGDEAIVLAGGAIEGFVGGTCAESTVREAAMELLANPDASPLVLRITPTPEPAQAGRRVVHNPCLSGGTVEVFLEPVVPPPLLVVAGRSPTARALATLGAGLGWSVLAWEDGEVIPPGAVAVVAASHGRGEEDVLSAAVSSGVPYVGLVASRRRGAAVVASLAVDGSLASAVRTPAGLDIGARTAGEVALSILAEIVGIHRRGWVPVPGDAGPSPAPVSHSHAESAGPSPAPAGHAGPPVAVPPRAGLPAGASIVDPVCSMTVFPEAGTPTAEHEGRTVWFCGRGCRDAFTADPAAYE